MMKQRMEQGIGGRLWTMVERGVDGVTLALFLLLLFLGIYALIDVYKVEKSAEVDAEVAKLAPDNDDDAEAKAKLEELSKINNEVVGWLRIDGTNIDYPVMEAADNAKYLTRDYRGEYATAGGVFVDYRNAQFEDDFTIVYGHRMSAGKMFSDVGRFKEEEFFETHKTGRLYTKKGIFKLSIRAFAVLSVGSTKIYAHEGNKNGANEAVAQEILAAAGQVRASVDEDQKLLLLSTCDNDSRHYRDVLLAEMVGE